MMATVLIVPQRLVHLSLVDMVIVVFYFALVLSIGWYLKGRANTGEDFFMAGREMTAWVAGLSFLSANLGALELMGWAGSAYQYGILATHWYWDHSIGKLGSRRLRRGAGQRASATHRNRSRTFRRERHL